MRLKLAVLFTLIVFPTLIHILAPEEKKHSLVPSSLANDLIHSTSFVLDDQSTIEYWRWQRQEMLPSDPVTWVMPGIGGPGSILDDEFANDLIEIMKSRYVDQIIVVQLRGHSLQSELACPLALEFDDCIAAHQENNIDLTKYHYLQYAQDVIDLRKHLGISHWHVWGASYGGRVAGAMAMLDPEAVSYLLLDSAVAMKPEDRPNDYETSRQLLHKLYAACVTFENCFDGIDGSLEELAQFIEDYETPTKRIYGIDLISVNKAEWIYLLNSLMYDYNFELAMKWIFLHITHPKGFTYEELPEELVQAFHDSEADWISEYEERWSINYYVTGCNEDPSQNTFKMTDYGVYGQHLDMANYCWPLKDWSETTLEVPDIPVMIVHLPFDNVITYQDGESYLKHWPYAQWCTLETMGHTMPWDESAEMIVNLSRNDAYAPSFCMPREPKLYTIVTE